ncbi:MAG TPA: AI-2E family transporter [Patescibacteria group bacterium]|nr:AI-2E family transporter [Patescibacteria group bacterium]
MPLKRVQLGSFLALLAVVSIMVFFIFKPFFALLSFAAILTIIFWPLRTFFFHWTDSKDKAAWLTFGCVLLFLLIALALLSTLIVKELADIITGLSNTHFQIPPWVVTLLPESLQAQLSGLLSEFGQILVRSASTAFGFINGLLSNVASFVISLILLLFALFYFLRDGDRIIVLITEISPITRGQEERLFNKITAAVNGVVKGTFMVGLVQGLIALVGFLIFGMPQPLLLAMLTIIASFIPTFGTSLIMIPSILYLLFTGDVTRGIGLGIWALVAVGLIDNFLGPKLISSKTNIHPLLVFFGVLGGLKVFGMLGVLLGPIVVAIFLALIDIYRTDIAE